jgi:hypothetical protein
MRVLLLTYGSHGNGEGIVGFAVQMGALVAKGRVCAPPSAPDLHPRGAELVPVQFDPVTGAAEEFAAPVGTGVQPTGGRQ